MRFWWAWPSVVTEGLSGVGLQFALHLWGPFHPWWLYPLAGVLVSVGYEYGLDRNGWSWTDVYERGLGQAVGELLWGLT